MTLQLNGQSERLPELHREFRGRYIEQMPLLMSGKNEKGKVVDVPRDPASFAYTIERRETAPKDVRRAWQNNYVFTGDAVSLGIDGSLVSTWDSPILRTVTPKSTLVNGVLNLSTAQWNELRVQKDGTLYLSADEVAEVYGKGYVKKDGVWTPENSSVAKVWEHLSKGRDLNGYVKMVADAVPGDERIMNVYLDSGRLSSPNLRSWNASSITYNSYANGSNNLGNGYGRLIGIAPEAHVAHEKVLEARV